MLRELIEEDLMVHVIVSQNFLVPDAMKLLILY